MCVEMIIHTLGMVWIFFVADLVPYSKNNVVKTIKYEYCQLHFKMLLSRRITN